MTSLKKAIYLLIVLLNFQLPIIAQQFGGNLPSTKWRQYNTDTSRIIFPKGMDTVALKIANMVNSMANRRPFTLGNKLKKVDIVLQNQPVVTNGYVSVGPFRSEFYMNPSADNYDASSLSYPTQLTIHEYRHVQQYNNFNNGLSSVMKTLFGQEGYALAVNAAVPNWFFEGDAVFIETQLAPDGRGTMPYFLKAFPALWQSGKNYSWMKLRNGSYKDYVPNHYDLGYLLVNYGTHKYGYDFWRKVTQDASAFKGLIYPMQKAIKQYSGMSYQSFRDSTFGYYKSQYGQLSNLQKIEANSLSPIDAKTVTNYYFPYQVSEKELLYQKSSYRKRPAFYLKSTEGEKLIRFRDISIDEQFGYNNGKIVYAAYESHPRWRWTSYSVLKLLDINTGKQKSLSTKSRYFSPDISPSGKTVVTNETELDGSSKLLIIDANTGNVKNKISKTGIGYFSNPKLINDSSAISILRNQDATTNIAQINLITGDIKVLTPPSFKIIGNIFAKDDKVYFSAAQGLKDELFYLNLRTQELFQMKTAGVGSYFINQDFGKTSWSTFTADGFQLQQLNSDAANWEPYPIEKFIQSQTGIMSGGIAAPKNYLSDTATTREVSPYRKLSHPFNLHSWRPNYSDPDFSFTIYGNNILNITETQLYYLYNENDKTHTAGGSMTYGGLFPYINIGSDYTFNRRAMVSKKLKQWDEWNKYVGVNIPLSWVSGQTYKSFNIGSRYAHRTDFNKRDSGRQAYKTQFNYLTHSISWSQQLQTTAQDIYPRLGYSARAQFRHALNNYNSWQAYSGISVYLPGLFSTQSLVLNGAIQYSGSTQRVFGSRIALARGFNTRDSAGIFTSSANYHIPVFYPDWGFGNIAYLSRVRANLFYDYSFTFNKTATRKSQLQSVGAEVYVDTKWWNQHPLTFGFRTGCALDGLPGQQRKMFFEFLLPTSLFPR